MNTENIDLEKLHNAAKEANKALIEGLHPKSYENYPDVFLNFLLMALAIPSTEMFYKLIQNKNNVSKKDIKKMSNEITAKFENAMEWSLKKQKEMH